MVFAATLYAKLLRIPLVVSYHTHIPEYIPKYTWGALVHPMWSIIRWCTRASDLTLVTSAAMKVSVAVAERPGAVQGEGRAEPRLERAAQDLWQPAVVTDRSG